MTGCAILLSIVPSPMWCYVNLNYHYLMTNCHACTSTLVNYVVIRLALGCNESSLYLKALEPIFLTPQSHGHRELLEAIIQVSDIVFLSWTSHQQYQFGEWLFLLFIISFLIDWKEVVISPFLLHNTLAVQPLSYLLPSIHQFHLVHLWLWWARQH